MLKPDLQEIRERSARQDGVADSTVKQLLAYIEAQEAQNRHDDEADTLCRNLICEERDAAEAKRDIYRETILSFISAVLTIKRENRPEWMEYLAERINEVCEVVGEEDRVAYNPRQEAILPLKK